MNQVLWNKIDVDRLARRYAQQRVHVLEDRVGAPARIVRRLAARRAATTPLVREQHLRRLVVERRRMPVGEVRIDDFVQPTRVSGIGDVEQDPVPRAGACGEADLSPGAVYRYFRSKEELLVRIYSEVLDESVEDGRKLDWRSGIFIKATPSEVGPRQRQPSRSTLNNLSPCTYRPSLPSARATPRRQRAITRI